MAPKLLEPTAITQANFPLLSNGHYYKTRRNPVLGIGLHVTAGLQDLDMLGIDHSAEGTLKYGQTTATEVSWHGIADSDSALFCLPSAYTAWHIYQYNSPTIGIEISNKDARWDNKPKAWIEATLRNAARLAAAYVYKYNLPLTLASKATVDNAIATGKKFGFSYHMWLNPTTRTDPGKTFPWAQFIGYVKEYLAGKVVDDLSDIMVNNPITGEPSPIAGALWSIWHYAYYGSVAANEANKAAAQALALTQEIAKKVDIDPAELDAISQRVGEEFDKRFKVVVTQADTPPTAPEQPA